MTLTDLFWVVGLPFAVVMAGLVTFALIVWSLLRMFRTMWPVMSDEGRELVVLAVIVVVLFIAAWQQGWFS